ncbi:regulator of chromosome condensation 1/beta-lactamase-inhibitor protein II, partial [Tricharina praecox]|uniref:regulator of chromosome condensation 1/beta-lactamase-inhibitor protein II n=1 Tax=Tricharina praecox TaxID=43433 RepID=UPI00221F821F
PILTAVPSDRVNVFACGTGEYGELGLGPSPKAKTVGRPRLNALLPIDSVGVVAVAYGGMHGMVLTHDGKVYTWGVNDLGALGRITKAKDEKLKDADADSIDSDDEDEVPLNEDESTPKMVEFPEGTVITRIAAGDSLSLAVTNTGQVYGWGTFRSNDGVLGFSEHVRIQQTPALVDNLKNIINVVCGNDHALALDVKGKAWAWGNGQQNQLGRRVVERTRMNGLRPRELGIPRKKVKSIHSGSFHSFAITTDGLVYSWGLNSFAQCGIYEEAKDDTTTLVVPVPTRVRALDDKDVIQVEGGDRHSIALTSKGELLAWGRMDAHQVGIDHEKLPVEDVILDVSGKPRCLIVPHKVCDGVFDFIASGSNHSIALAREDGSAYSWGFGDLFQCGQGPSGVDVAVPTKIENTATKGVRMTGAACGGQVTVLAGLPAPSSGAPNGV